MNNIFLFNSALKGRFVSFKTPYSKKLVLVCAQLYKKGYIAYYTVSLPNNTIIIYLNYYLLQPMLNGLVKISKPGHKKYYTCKQLKKHNKIEREMYILSTSRGILLSDEAILHNVGGEILYRIE